MPLKMPKLPPALPQSEPDPALFKNLMLFERIALAAVVVIVAVNLAGWLMPVLGQSVPPDWRPMKGESALIVLFGAFSLYFSAASESRARRHLSLFFAGLMTLGCAAVLAQSVFHVFLNSGLPAAAGRGLESLFSAKMSPQTAAGLGLLGITVFFARARRLPAVLTADALMFGLAFLVLTVVSGHFIAKSHLFDTSTAVKTNTSTMLCLLMLTIVAFLRRAEFGVFAVFLGSGAGSKIARGLAPVILLLPYLREAARAHLFGAAQMPNYYTTAIVASLAVVLLAAILLYLAWRINSMETEIHELSLRDGLTDLYNLRGFRLLAEQALRMAQRSNAPFSVLYIDLDDLKRTNDTLGHQAGSELLIAAAEILKSSFRETDVVGRIGGDEFAVAGQFSEPHIGVAAQQLEDSAARWNREQPRHSPLSISVGHVTADAELYESIDDLLAKADRVMYEAKRRKKMLVP